MAAWIPYSSFFLLLSSMTSAAFFSASLRRPPTAFSIFVQYLKIPPQRGNLKDLQECVAGMSAAAALCNLVKGSPEMQTAIMLSLKNPPGAIFWLCCMRRSGRRAVQPGRWEASCQATICL